MARAFIHLEFIPAKFQDVVGSYATRGSRPSAELKELLLGTLTEVWKIKLGCVAYAIECLVAGDERPSEEEEV